MWLEFQEFLRSWLPLFTISLLSAAVRMYLSERKFTFFHYFMAVLIAVLAAYLAKATCTWLKLDDDLSVGIIGVASYVAPHLLDSIDKIAIGLTKEPFGLFMKLLIKINKED